MATKRPAAEPIGAPPVKKPTLTMSPLDIGPAAGEEDLDIKVLQVQNRKLSECLQDRNRNREQLEQRIQRFEHNHEEHVRFQVALKQQFTRLKKHLEVAMVSVGGYDCVINVEDGMKGVEGIRRLFESVCDCVEKLCKGNEDKIFTSEEVIDETGNTGQTSSVYSRSLTMLEELSRQHKNEAEFSQLQEDFNVMETELDELQEEVDNLRFSLVQSQTRCDRLEKRLEGTLIELQTRPLIRQTSEEGVALPAEEDSSTGSGPDGGVASVNKITTEEADSLQEELIDAKQISQSRLEEVERLSSELVKAKNEVDSLILEQQQLPEEVVRDSPIYKALQAQFSIAALEVSQMRNYLNEAKTILMTARQQQFSQLEEIRAEEVKYQMEVRDEMAALEGALGTIKREYELLRVEYERTIASNEQAGPVARELRITVDSLQKTINQHKSEMSRYKSRTHKSEQQLTKFQEEKSKEGSEKMALSVVKDATSDLSKEDESESVKSDETSSEMPSKLEITKKQVKLLEEELESYKEACTTENRDKAETIAAEKKLHSQVEESKKRCEDYRREYEKRKERIREEANRKTKSLTEDNRHLQKDLSAKKHEAQALVAEMECATQAFEEMQEQNIRLLQQLKEKDDANFKLMSERIKSNSIHKLLMEEKEVFQSQLNAMAVERQRYGNLVTQLEERENTMEVTLQTVDKELTLQQLASEAHRKKAQESLQGLAEVQFQVNGRQKQVDTIQETLANRTRECEQEMQLHKRSMEEVGTLKRKLEKYKSREWMVAGDEVLLEEIKMYRAKLNCPCCSARKKDTVLTKCFHVFCSECIRNRYDSRLRKCPKCGAAFGANDFHKIYLS